MIVNAYWYASGTSGTQCVGIVQIVQEHEKEHFRQTGEANFKYYIGVGQGLDEKEDSELISNWGAPFDTDAGNKLFRVIGND
jgi:hypothetical protein